MYILFHLNSMTECWDILSDSKKIYIYILSFMSPAKTHEDNRMMRLEQEQMTKYRNVRVRVKETEGSKGRHWRKDKYKGDRIQRSHRMTKGIIIHEGGLAWWKLETRTIKIAWTRPKGGEQYPYWENINWSELISVICNSVSVLMPSQTY